MVVRFDGAQRWDILSVEQPAKATANNYNEALPSVCSQIPTQQELEDLKKRVYDEAFQQGLEDGRKQALNESDSLLKVAQGLMNQLSEPIQFIAKQIVKAELKNNAEYILKLVDQAIR